MNEIAKQIIQLGRLIGKKVFIKHYSFNGNYYNDSDCVDVFTVEDFENYSYNLLHQDIKILEIKYTKKFGSYYLITFKDL